MLLRKQAAVCCEEQRNPLQGGTSSYLQGSQGSETTILLQTLPWKVSSQSPGKAHRKTHHPQCRA